MAQPYEFRRLRTYLLAYFIPLTGVPLFVLAALAYVLLGKAVDREISKRAGPELSAVARNIDTMERRLEKAQADFFRREGVREIVADLKHGFSPDDLNSWAQQLPVESLRIYSMDGRLVAESKPRDAKKLNETWLNFFGPRIIPSQTKESREASLNPDSWDSTREEIEKSPRLPATNANSGIASSGFSSRVSRYADTRGRQLTKDFLAFLRRESSASVREVNSDGSAYSNKQPVLDLLQYRLLLDTEYRAVAFVEGRLPLDSDRLKILGAYQGIDLVLFDPAMNLIAATDADISSQMKSWLATFQEKALLFSKVRNSSAELVVARDPIEFFFTPLASDGGGESPEAAWIAIGINKRAQVQLRNQAVLWIGSLAALLAGIVVLMTIRLSDRITKPVTDLVRATEAMKQGEWVHPVDADSQTEIGVLVRRFNEMSQSVQVTKRTLELKLEELATAHGELTKTQGQLVQSAKMSSLGQLVAGVAHELNNPIAFIYSNMTQMRNYLKNLDRVQALLQGVSSALTPEQSEMMKKTLDEIEWDYVRKDMADMVQACLEGSVRVKDIVIGLRNFSRLDKGEIVELDANQSLENTAKLLNSLLKNRIEIHWNLCKDSKLRGNPSQLNQVFMNIMANALQAIEGRGDVWIQTEVEGTGVEEVLKVSIRDSGKGIKKEHLDKIFDPFFTTKKVGEGTGLGLSIVYGIVERHRGTIQVKSIEAPQAGHGTEFILRFSKHGQQLLPGSSRESAA